MSGKQSRTGSSDVQSIDPSGSGASTDAQDLFGNSRLQDTLLGAGAGLLLGGPLGAVVGGGLGYFLGGPDEEETAAAGGPAVQAPGPNMDVGLFDDPEGFVDRAIAETELADQFDIVPDDFVGPRLPNQVTQAEFERVAATYSDIRLGRTDLQLDAAMSDDQREGTMGDLGHILQTESGRELLNTLAYAPNPNSGTHPTTTLQATANPLSIGASGFQQPGAVNGQGANSTVTYAPGQDVNIPGSTDPWNPYPSHVALFHEMTHAYHNHQGTNLRTSEGEDMAAGTGAHTGDPITENRYREERRLLGENVPNRDHY